MDCRPSEHVQGKASSSEEPAGTRGLTPFCRGMVFAVLCILACTRQPDVEQKENTSEVSSGRGGAPQGDADSGDKLSNFFKYQEAMAPYVRKLSKIARDPANGNDPAKVAKAISADAELKTLPTVTNRALRRTGLTAADAKTQHEFVVDALAVLDGDAASLPNSAASDLATKHGSTAVTRATSHREEYKRAKEALSTDMPIDCGRQPDSCSCQECPSGDTCPAYTACVEGCIVDLAACALQNAGPQAFLCLVAFNFCGLDCQSMCN